jgi:hypothetical protein
MLPSQLKDMGRAKYTRIIGQNQHLQVLRQGFLRYNSGSVNSLQFRIRKLVPVQRQQQANRGVGAKKKHGTRNENDYASNHFFPPWLKVIYISLNLAMQIDFLRNWDHRLPTDFRPWIDKSSKQMSIGVVIAFMGLKFRESYLWKIAAPHCGSRSRPPKLKLQALKFYFCVFCAFLRLYQALKSQYCRDNPNAGKRGGSLSHPGLSSSRPSLR